MHGILGTYAYVCISTLRPTDADVPGNQCMLPGNYLLITDVQKDDHPGDGTHPGTAPGKHALLGTCGASGGSPQCIPPH